MIRSMPVDVFMICVASVASFIMFIYKVMLNKRQLSYLAVLFVLS